MDGSHTAGLPAVAHVNVGERERRSGLYNAFAARIVPLLIENARQQLEAGADIVMMFDTAAGSLPPDVFGGDIARDVRAIATAHPGKVGYYSRDFSEAHEQAGGFDTIPLAGVGLDMHRDLAAALRKARRSVQRPSFRSAKPNGRSFIHGNMDNRDLLLTGASAGAGTRAVRGASAPPGRGDTDGMDVRPWARRPAQYTRGQRSEIRHHHPRNILMTCPENSHSREFAAESTPVDIRGGGYRRSRDQEEAFLTATQTTGLSGREIALDDGQERTNHKRRATQMPLVFARSCPPSAGRNGRPREARPALLQAPASGPPDLLVSCSPLARGGLRLIPIPQGNGRA